MTKADVQSSDSSVCKTAPKLVKGKDAISPAVHGGIAGTLALRPSSADATLLAASSQVPAAEFDRWRGMLLL